MDQPITTQPPVRYCLYARKSTEQDEMQALSIDSQTKEMQAVAERDGLDVVEIRRESHSAKASGLRPVYNSLIQDIGKGKFNGILTWAPDRLSRNAGDLGVLVDLMDRGALAQIRTHTQIFTNNPNEKFLLMILCSQAKLENDNRSVNVKRGFRAKVEMGYRPNMAPLGYLHDKHAPLGTKRVFIDKERAPIIKQMFDNVAEHCWSGRRIRDWFDEIHFTSRTGKRVSLSTIYLMLGNPYYTGRFEFPVGSGKWFQGKHPQLVTQELFDKVQENLRLVPKGIPGTKEFTFTRLFTCGNCGSGVTAEEKIKKLKDGTVKRYVYYHCAGAQRKDCKEPSIREEDLLAQLSDMVDQLTIDEVGALGSIKKDLEKLKKLLALVAGEEQVINLLPKMDLYVYAKFMLEEGSREEQRNLLSNVQGRLVLKGKRVFSE